MEKESNELFISTPYPQRTTMIAVDAKYMPLWCRIGTLLTIPFQIIRFLITGEADIGKYELRRNPE